MPNVPVPNKPWWGTFSIQHNQNLSWNIAERSIIVERKKTEWKTWDIRQPEAQDNQIVVVQDVDTHSINSQTLPQGTIGRHLVESTGEQIHVLPALADRSVVARPVTPLRILTGEKVDIYISTPLWFTVCLDTKKDPILDLPFFRPSDSWFGTSPREGEVCYAKYTDALLELSNIEGRQHRAVTPIRIINKDKSKPSIVIERISVPVPLLSLYSDSEFQLWTNEIVITHDTDGNNAVLVLGKTAPAEANNAEFVRPSRVTAERSNLVRSISSLFA